MRRIETLSELLRLWKSILAALDRDPMGGRRLAFDPAGTLRTLGYELGPDARAALARIFV